MGRGQLLDKAFRLPQPPIPVPQCLRSATKCSSNALYHYTSAQNIARIVGCSCMIPSTGDDNTAAFGDGVYWTDMSPDQASNVSGPQFSYAITKSPRGGWNRKYDYFVEVDRATLAVPADRVRSVGSLDLPHQDKRETARRDSRNRSCLVTASGARRYVYEYFAEEDRDLYYELDNRGFTVRNIDIVRASTQPEAAVATSEWNAARDYGDLNEYMAKFGGIVMENIGENLEAAPYEDITASAFEEVWERCRAELEGRWATGGRDEYERASASEPRWKPLKKRSSQ